MAPSCERWIFATHRTSPSPLVGEGWGEGAGARKCVSTPSFRSRSSGPPYDSGGRVEESPQGGRRDAASFSTGHGCPVEKPRNPTAYLPSKGRKARHPGCSFFWHCHHLGGYFLLGKQEKVPQPSAEGRKPAAGEQPSHIATTKRSENWNPGLAPLGVRRDDEQRPTASSQPPAAPPASAQPAPAPAPPSPAAERNSRSGDTRGCAVPAN